MQKGLFVANSLSLVALLGMGIELWPFFIKHFHLRWCEVYLVIPALILWGLLLLCFFHVLGKHGVKD